MDPHLVWQIQNWMLNDLGILTITMGMNFRRAAVAMHPVEKRLGEIKASIGRIIGQIKLNIANVGVLDKIDKFFDEVPKLMTDQINIGDPRYDEYLALANTCQAVNRLAKAEWFDRQGALEEARKLATQSYIYDQADSTHNLIQLLRDRLNAIAAQTGRAKQEQLQKADRVLQEERFEFDKQAHEDYKDRWKDVDGAKALKEEQEKRAAEEQEVVRRKERKEDRRCNNVWAGVTLIGGLVGGFFSGVATNFFTSGDEESAGGEVKCNETAVFNGLRALTIETEDFIQTLPNTTIPLSLRAALTTAQNLLIGDTSGLVEDAESSNSNEDVWIATIVVVTLVLCCCLCVVLNHNRDRAKYAGPDRSYFLYEPTYRGAPLRWGYNDVQMDSLDPTEEADIWMHALKGIDPTMSSFVGQIVDGQQAREYLAITHI